MRIRPGVAVDRAFIRELSALVFARFGDYETTLPLMARRPDVHTLIAEADRQRIGFAMYTMDAPEADLLAIAVLPERQSQGAGKLLLQEVESAVRGCAGEALVRLSVALDNTLARRLFERCGYQYRPEEQGVYPGGQPSITMWKRLPES